MMISWLWHLQGDLIISPARQAQETSHLMPGFSINGGNCLEQVMKKMVLTLGGMAIMATIPVAANAASCTNATLKGNYALQGFGVQGVAEPFEYINVVRTNVFDGKGKFSGAGYRQRDGVFETISASGKYAVKADCSVTFDGSLSGVTNTQWGLIVDGGNKIFALRKEEGQNLNLTYEKQ